MSQSPIDHVKWLLSEHAWRTFIQDDLYKHNSTDKCSELLHDKILGSEQPNPDIGMHYKLISVNNIGVSAVNRCRQTADLHQLSAHRTLGHEPARHAAILCSVLYGAASLRLQTVVIIDNDSGAHTSDVLRLECSIDCISGSVGHQQNIFRSFSHCQFLLKKTFLKKLI